MKMKQSIPMSQKKARGIRKSVIWAMIVLCVFVGMVSYFAHLASLRKNLSTPRWGDLPVDHQSEKVSTLATVMEKASVQQTEADPVSAPQETTNSRVLVEFNFKPVIQQNQ